MIRPMNALGELMRAARVLKGHTQEAAANAAGLKRGIWSLYEEGYEGNPTMRVLSGIANYVQRSMEDVSSLIHMPPSKEIARPADSLPEVPPSRTPSGRRRSGKPTATI